MTNHPIDKMDSLDRKHTGLPTDEQTNAAWEKLTSKLQQQEASPVWEAWSREGITAEESEPKSARAAQENLVEEHDALRKHLNAASTEHHQAKPAPAAYRSWLKKHGMKTGIAAAAVLICAVIATPTTNNALAAILSKFKMNQVAVVQEDDFRTALEGFFGTDVSVESTNKYGKFERSVIGKGYPELTADQALEDYGIQVPEKLYTPIGEQTELQINAQQGQAITFRLDVDAINGVMKKLGAEKLLPASVDGKPITLRMDQGVNADYHIVDKDDNDHFIGLSITPAPVLDMDPSIDAEDAYEALIRFPILPQNLKSVLMQSTRISEGEIPFPLIADGKVTKTVLKGTDVYLENSVSNGGGWSATWLEEGLVKRVSLYDIKSREDAEKIVKELIIG
ncbi:DUF4179 domain-containing protein [Paenibacillus lupini]|uniref:DUF4179 domain-containing protein n=1 Tax=Paenibacillus lupini TaxID=1450204 RepID=UPI0014221811|nr:DUF4179 domain-containing protein [Paenibacillus lupini]NIK21616.1 hypothetical protein [Paenibacillus lupini]